MRGAKHISLFVGVEMVILPPHWILAYIFYMFFIVLTASDHVVIEASLPNVFAILLVAKALKCRYKLRTNVVRSLNICRDSRPYDTREDTPSVLCTNRYKICTDAIVIKIISSRGFSFWQFFFLIHFHHPIHYIIKQQGKQWLWGRL